MPHTPSAEDRHPIPGRGASSVERLATAFDALDDLPAIRNELRQVTRVLIAQATAGAMAIALQDGLHPDHAYPTKMACRFLGIEPASFLKISKTALPRVGTGRVLGIDLMAYRGDITADEAAAFKALRRAAVTGRAA